MAPQALHLMQLELECKGISEEGRLVRIPGDEPDDIELVQLTRYPDATVRILLRDDVEEEVATKLRKLSPSSAFEHPQLIADALGEPRRTWLRGRSYMFPKHLARPPDVIRVDPQAGSVSSEPSARRPRFVVNVEGETICCCCSSRENQRAAEAWVETDPAHRRQGHARRAVAAWAADVRASSKIPFYSHADDNLASAGVARSLGLEIWVRYINFELGT